MSSSLAELAEVHAELRAMVREILAKSGSEAVNGEVDWGLIARSGAVGLEVQAEFDGADATFGEVALVLQEIGRTASRTRYVTVAALGVGALNLLESRPERDRLLCDTAAGYAAPIVVLGGETLGESTFRIDQNADGYQLSGHASFVLDASAADSYLVPAREADGNLVVVNIDPRAAGLTVTEQEVLDATRNFGSVTASCVVVGPESVWRVRDDASNALTRLCDRAAVAVACDSLGLSEAMLEATVDYVGVREQFGRRIGSFQAVKHACADMLVQVTIARSLVAAAVRALTQDTSDASVAAAMAKSYACSAAVDIAGKAMQLHGGMGYTWESGLHVYLKRATLNRSLFGSPAAHRTRLAQRYFQES